MCPGVSNLWTLQSYIVIYKCAKFMHSYADTFLSTWHELEPPWKRDLSGRIASIGLDISVGQFFNDCLIWKGPAHCRWYNPWAGALILLQQWPNTFTSRSWTQFLRLSTTSNAFVAWDCKNSFFFLSALHFQLLPPKTRTSQSQT